MDRHTGRAANMDRRPFASATEPRRQRRAKPEHRPGVDDTPAIRGAADT
jgi:hypothetical protein